MTDNTYPDTQLGREVVGFLVREAELLDNGLYREWLALLTQDIVYQLPVRATVRRQDGSGFSDQAWHMNETWTSLELRVNRLYTNFAWADDPPPRTRRFVTNFRIEPGDSASEVRVKSNILVYRSMYDLPAVDIIAGERDDALRRVDGRWNLARRLVLLDHTVIASHNLAIFF